MRFLKRFFMVFGILMSIVFALYIVDWCSASADTYVQLTPQQTLALYGETLPGSYWNGDEYKDCTFKYVGFVEPYGANQTLWFTYGDDIPDMAYQYMGERPWLVYACPDGFVNGFFGGMDDYVTVSNPAYPPARFTIRMNASIPISGITYFRQFLGFSLPASNSVPYNADYSYATINTTYSNLPVTVHPYYYNSSGSKESFCSFEIKNIINDTNGFILGRLNVFDFDLSAVEDGEPVVFGVDTQIIASRRIDKLTVPGTDTKFYLFFVGCPFVSDGYVLPEVPETTPNYNSRLDDIIEVQQGTNSILMSILAKLDIIAQMMAQGESTPSLQDPDTIGFDSRTKQDILRGLQNGDSALDSVRPSDLGTAAAGGMFDFWDRLTAVFPPGLMAVYMFALVGGVVSWVIFGKRGG